MQKTEATENESPANTEAGKQGVTLEHALPFNLFIYVDQATSRQSAFSALMKEHTNIYLQHV